MGDSRGAFGGVSNPGKRRELRQGLHAELRKGDASSFHQGSNLFNKVNEISMDVSKVIKKLVSACEANTALSRAAQNLMNSYYTFQGFADKVAKQGDAERKNRIKEISSGNH